MKFLAPAILTASLFANILPAMGATGEMNCAMITQQPSQKREQKMAIIQLHVDEQEITDSVGGANFRISYDLIPAELAEKQANLRFEIEGPGFSYENVDVFRTDAPGWNRFTTGWITVNRGTPEELSYVAACVFVNE